MMNDKPQTADLFEVTIEGSRLVGRIFNDSNQRFRDGLEVRSSPIERIGLVGGRIFAITMNTIYEIKSWGSLGLGSIKALTGEEEPCKLN